MPPTVKVRFSGGLLHGKEVWVEDGCSSLRVYLMDEATGTKRALLYEKENMMFVYQGESEVPVPTSTALSVGGR